MSDLRETLAAISAALHSLPARVGGPQEIGESLEHATDGFLRQMHQYESSAAGLVGHAHQAMAGLGHEAAEAEAQVESETEALESTLHQASQTFAERRHQVAAESESTRQAMEAFQQHLTQAGAAAQAAHEEAGRALIALEQTLRDAQQELRTAVAEAQREAEGLQVAAETGRAEVEGALRELGKVMTSLAEDAGKQLQHTLNQVDGMTSRHAQAVHSAQSTLQSQAETLQELLRGAIERELKGKLIAASGAAAQQLNVLAAEALEEAERTTRSRGDLEQALQALEGEKPSVTDVIDHVKNAVEIVGLIWGA